MRALAKEIPKILWPLLIALTSLGCEDLGFHASERAQAVQFDGIKSISVTPEGRYVLTWDFIARSGSDVSSYVYEIYMTKWETLPETVLNSSRTLTDTAVTNLESAKALQSKIVSLEDSTAPAGRGSLIASVKGVRNYTIDEKLMTGVTYGFQVRAIDSEGTRDANQSVLVYSPGGALNFLGASSLELSPSGTLLLRWQQPSGSVWHANEFSYEIYMETVNSDIATAAAKAEEVPKNPGQAAEAAQVGRIYKFPESDLPSSRVALLGERTGGTYFEVTTPLIPDQTYIFQVTAKTPDGAVGISPLLALYRPEVLKFAGLQDDNVVIAPDKSKIILSWDKASGSQGPVSYIIYGDVNFSEVLGKTSATSFEFKIPVEGKQYVFAVRAKDSKGIDSNREFVVIDVPLTPTAPKFDGLESASLSFEGYPYLKWKSASDTATLPAAMAYEVFRSTSLAGINFQTPHATVTGTLNFKDTSVSWGSTYFYVVRAKNQSGLSDSNTVQLSATPLPQLIFDGLESATALSGTRVQLRWGAAIGAVGAISYKIYQNGNLNTPIAVTTKTSFQVSGLAGYTTYTFAVRAQDSARYGDEGSGSFTPVTTFGDGYPDFAGIRALSPIAGIAGQTKLTAAWTSAVPASGTSLTGYNVYVATSPGDHNFNTPTFTTGLTTFTLTDLIPDTTYYVVVRATANNGLSDENTVEISASTSAAQAVSFAGLQSASIGIGSAGFNTVMLSWLPGTGTFDQYQVFMRQEGVTFNFSTPVKTITDLSLNGTTLTGADGIQPNKKQFFLVRAVNTDAISQDDLNTVEKFVTTSPSRPSFAGISTATLPNGVVGLSNADISWQPATGTFNTYGVFTRYPNGPGATSYNFALNPGQTNFAGTYTSVNGSLTSARVPGLSVDTQVCFAVRAFWYDGVNFLLDTQDPIIERCVMPTLSPPVFGGVLSAIKNASNPSSSIDVSWAAATGVFDHYDVYLGTSASEVRDIADNSSQTCPVAITSCRHTGLTTSLTSRTITGLSPGLTVYVLVRAGYLATTKDANTVTTFATLDAMAGLALAWTTQPSGSLPGQNMPTQPRVRLVDSNTGSTVTGMAGIVTLSVATGSGTLASATANINSVTGIATFVTARFDDTNLEAPQPYTLIASMPGVANSPTSALTQNSVGACVQLYSGQFTTAKGGCMHNATGLVFSKASDSTMSWHDAIKGCASGTDCDVYTGVPGAHVDLSPGTGYCQDLVESGYSDWRLPTHAELSATGGANVYMIWGAARYNSSGTMSRFWNNDTVTAIPSNAVAITGSNASQNYQKVTDALALCVRGP